MGATGFDFAQGDVGPYRVLTRLSVGGMAEVFLALAPELDGKRSLVTLKRILPELREQPEFVEMFLEEARISQALSHPNIARVFELSRESGELFLVMEYVPGQSLASLQRLFRRLNRPVPLGFVGRVAIELCKALTFAHRFATPTGEAMPIVHRDVSPSNVMTTYAGAVKVIDFGVAKARGSLSRTLTGGVKGSLGYMSPEQARGAPLSPRSDLFSAGVVLHELLTGRPLFLRDSALVTIRGILRDEIPTPISLNPGVPPRLSEAVMTALTRDPAGRFASAQDLGQAVAETIPGLLYDAKKTAELMGDVFREQAEKTRALLELADRSGPASSLTAAAQGLDQSGSDGRRRAGTDVFGPLPTGVMRLEQLPPEQIPEEQRVEGAVVLSVDDSEISRQFVAAHLEAAGFPVLSCGSPREALELMAQRLPDLLLLDVRMPGINGFDLCRHVRRQYARRPFLPVLFLSAATSFEERLEGIAAGGNDFILKPYEPDDLVGLVRAHLKRAAFLQRLDLARRKGS